MSNRPKHQRKEGEQLLAEAESKGWKVTKGKKYFKMTCPCEGKHMEWVHLTPSQNHFKNKRNLLKSLPCWRDA